MLEIADNAKEVFLEPDDLNILRSPKGFTEGKIINSFQEIGFSGPIVPCNNCPQPVKIKAEGIIISEIG